jgi:hypothetical protein
MERIGPIMSKGGKSSPEFESLRTEEERLATADAGCLEPNYAKLSGIRKRYEDEYSKTHVDSLTQAKTLLDSAS